MAIKAIIFGSTGAVGGAAAREAHRQGVEVILAMRDTTKSAPTGTKVQADLTDPSSVEKAVKETGATVAFCYVAHGSEMTPTFEAMKRGGIDYVVLLSSWAVYPDAKEAAASEDFIAKMHAKAELALDELGIKYTALRPNYFASNVFHQSEGIKKGQVYLYKPERRFDFLAPEDIGAVAAAKLLSGPEIVPIAGPELLSQREAFDIVGKELGQEIHVIEIDKEEFRKNLPLPEPIVRVLIKDLEESEDKAYPPDLYRKASSNIKKYTGRDPIKFPDFIRSQKSKMDHGHN